MPKCPKCGETVEEPVKTWILRNNVKIGLYKCPSCGAYFRAKA